jgi:hypothetical protein
VTGSTPRAGDTQVPDESAEQPPGIPWAATGPDEAWWHDRGDFDGAIEPADAEHASVEPANSEPADAEHASVEPAKSEPADAEPADPEPAEAEPANAEPAYAEILASYRPVTAESRQESEDPEPPAWVPDDHPDLIDVVPVPLPPQSQPPRPHGEDPAAVLAGPFSWRQPSDEPYAAETEPRTVPAPAQAADDEPFWMPTEEVARDDTDAAWPAPRMRAGRRTGSLHRSPSATTRTAPARSPRRAGPALTALVALSLLAAFFGWVSAEPFWLAVGHGSAGTATVDRCTGSGVAQRCVGRFAEADGRFVTARVTLLGVTDAERHAGAAVGARMVGSGSDRAYVRTDGLGLHLRWGLGLALVLLCGAGIAWATGATRLENPLARRRAVLASLAGPLLLALGFLAAAW